MLVHNYPSALRQNRTYSHHALGEPREGILVSASFAGGNACNERRIRQVVHADESLAKASFQARQQSSGFGHIVSGHGIIQEATSSTQLGTIGV
jgi:hypothetical protein